VKEHRGCPVVARVALRFASSRTEMLAHALGTAGPHERISNLPQASVCSPTPDPGTCVMRPHFGGARGTFDMRDSLVVTGTG